ncbi:MAG: histidine kinase [Bacteroidales bacterium]
MRKFYNAINYIHPLSKNVKQYARITIIVSLAISVIIHFPLLVNYLLGGGRDFSGHEFSVSFNHLSTDIIISFVVATLVFLLNYKVLKPFDRHFNLKITTIILAAVISIISVFLLNHLLYSLKGLIDPEYYHHGDHDDEFIFTNFFIASLVIACVLIMRLLYLRQAVVLENEELKREALTSQYESLKNQLSPHFMFNSLTALKTLIAEDPIIAEEYVGNLSRTLRYTLRSNEKKLVTLDEELEFMNSYLYLIKIRYGDNLVLEKEIDPSYGELKLPPLSIQTLVENAIKHNEISKRNPLLVRIRTGAGKTLSVENRIQEKITGESGTGIGLSNMAKQFELLNGEEISIKQEDGNFIVEIPLLPENYESTDNRG